MSTLMGARPENVTARKIEGGVWKDTPYFAPGLEEDSDHMKAFPIGSTLIGRLVDIRETKAEKAEDRRNYACLETTDGQKFRVQAPGSLTYKLGEAGVGSLVEITYRGKEQVEGYKQPLHQFDVEVLEVLN